MDSTLAGLTLVIASTTVEGFFEPHISAIIEEIRHHKTDSGLQVSC
jgi:hypothetical protein